MFKLLRQNTLESRDVSWTLPGRAETSDIATFIECWNFIDDSGKEKTIIHHGSLKEPEIIRWAEKEIPLRIPTDKRESFAVIGGLKLLICNRRQGEVYDMVLPISAADFSSLERHLHLHEPTLPSLFNLNGISSKFSTYGFEDMPRLKNMSIVIKASQRRRIGTWGISLHHNFTSSITTAFVLAEELEMSYEWSHYVMNSLSEEILGAITSIPSSCCHPVFLPTILLSIHIHRAVDHSVWHSSSRLHDLEKELGPSRAGTLARTEAKFFFNKKSVRKAHEESRRPLVDLNSRLTDFHFVTKVLAWQVECVTLLLGIMDEISDSTPRTTSHQKAEKLSSPVWQMLEYLKSPIKNLQDYTSEHMTRVQLQLDGLYLFQAQIDTFLSAHLAEAAGLDGIAMKTMVFVTTVFLPPTFVATLFSMSMFDWKASASQNVVSSRFWIYWVVTIMIGILIVLVFFQWYPRELGKYKRQVWDRPILLGDDSTSLESRHNSPSKRGAPPQPSPPPHFHRGAEDPQENVDYGSQSTWFSRNRTDEGDRSG